jgi:hypothetical protein
MVFGEEPVSGVGINDDPGRPVDRQVASPQCRVAIELGANEAYVELMGDHRPARTLIGVQQLPKPGVMKLTGINRANEGIAHDASNKGR